MYIEKKKKNQKTQKPLKRRFKNFAHYLKIRRLNKKRQETPKMLSHFHHPRFYKKIKQGIFLKQPCYNQIKYPFFLNLKLISEYIKKK